ncbi:MAG: MoaD/ThiS family protein [Candidatus Erginobacter occultus]|nr:MoaD/ThiS family protein [Candidatus Erginobacter occultus]
MKITVTAVSKFRRYFPARTNEVEFPGGNLAGFLDWVKEEYGLDIDEHRNLKLTLNSVLVRDTGIELKEGDRVAFIPIVAGG